MAPRRRAAKWIEDLEQEHLDEALRALSKAHLHLYNLSRTVSGYKRDTQTVANMIRRLKKKLRR